MKRNSKASTMFVADLEESLNSARFAERQNEFVGVNMFQRLLCNVLCTSHAQSTSTWMPLLSV